MAHHDPTVTAAVITVVGTGSIAIVGYITTMITTHRALKSAEKTAQNALESAEKTSRDALEASESNVQETVRGEREHRLWERRTESYLDVLAFLAHRGAVRQHQASMNRWDEETEQARESLLDSYVPRGTWFDLEARLQAYATEPVISGVLETNAAHQDYVSAAMAIQFATPGEASVAAFRKRDETVKAAEAKDTTLIELIRDEIQRIR